MEQHERLSEQPHWAFTTQAAYCSYCIVLFVLGFMSSSYCFLTVNRIRVKHIPIYILYRPGVSSRISRNKRPNEQSPKNSTFDV